MAIHLMSVFVLQSKSRPTNALVPLNLQYSSKRVRTKLTRRTLQLSAYLTLSKNPLK